MTKDGPCTRYWGSIWQYRRQKQHWRAERTSVRESVLPWHDFRSPREKSWPIRETAGSCWIWEWELLVTEDLSWWQNLPGALLSMMWFLDSKAIGEKHWLHANEYPIEACMEVIRRFWNYGCGTLVFTWRNLIRKLIGWKLSMEDPGWFMIMTWRLEHGHLSSYPPQLELIGR
jgi:hypothetical protein